MSGQISWVIKFSGLLGFVGVTGYLVGRNLPLSSTPILNNTEIGQLVTEAAHESLPTLPSAGPTLDALPDISPTTLTYEPLTPTMTLAPPTPTLTLIPPTPTMTLAPPTPTLTFIPPTSPPSETPTETLSARESGLVKYVDCSSEIEGWLSYVVEEAADYLLFGDPLTITCTPYGMDNLFSGVTGYYDILMKEQWCDTRLGCTTNFAHELGHLWNLRYYTKMNQLEKGPLYNPQLLLDSVPWLTAYIQTCSPQSTQEFCFEEVAHVVEDYLLEPRELDIWLYNFNGGSVYEILKNEVFMGKEFPQIPSE